MTGTTKRNKHIVKKVNISCNGHFDGHMNHKSAQCYNRFHYIVVDTERTVFV